MIDKTLTETPGGSAVYQGDRTRGADGIMYGGWTGPIVMLIATLIAYIDRQALSVLAPMILKDTGLNAGDFGAIVLSFSIAYMLSNPIWGSILDYVGLRMGLAIAVGIWTLASASHALVVGFIGFAVARTVLGIGEGAVFPGCMKMSTDCLPLAKRSRGTAIGYSGAAAGALITPIIVIPFAIRFGWRAAFWVTGALGTAWLIGWYFICRPPKVPVNRGKLTKVSLPKLNDRRVWLVVSTYGLGAIGLGVGLYMMPLYLNRAAGVSQKDLAYITWIPYVAYWLGYYFWAWVSDKIVGDNPRPVGLLLLLSALALPCALMGRFHTWPILVAFFSWMLFVADGFITMGLHVGARVFPKEQSAMAAGIGGGSWGIVVGVASWIYGRWIDRQMFEPIFVTMSLVPLLGTLLFIALSGPWAKGKVAPEVV